MIKNIIVFLLISSSVFAQNKEGKISYKYTIFWNKIYRELEFLSQEERDRELLTWGNSEGYSTKMNLFFSPEKSLYTYSDEVDKERGGYSWRKDEYIIYRDFQNENLIELQETLGKSYIIKDSLQKYKWKILNELKEIQGHLCMKASTYNKEKGYEVVAWFAGDIPVSTGPETYYGLPGLILELNLNDGSVIIQAEKISFESVEKELQLPKKMKGKEITVAELNIRTVDHIKISNESKRNPFWAMRY